MMAKSGPQGPRHSAGKTEAGEPAATRDIIVMGGSSGSIEAISEILPKISPQTGAAIFIVVHTGEDSPNYLVSIFSKYTSLPVQYAADREPIELGRVYVAAPDRHLLIKSGEMRVVFGPKENNFRPALDPLFRTAATTYGRRVIGVILSGSLDDGTHGLLQIKRAGGVAIAQDPSTALHPGMPESAIDRVTPDYVAPSSEIGPLLNQLVGGAIGKSEPLGDDQLDPAEGAISALRLNGVKSPTPFICPECNGALWETLDEGGLKYRCHVGHGFTVDTLLALQAIEIEQALWSAVRTFEERAALQRRTAERTVADQPLLRDRMLDNAVEQQRMADVIRKLLVGPELDKHSGVGEALREEYTHKQAKD
jgi:two-component system chemotaxis response regulator CheB